MCLIAINHSNRLSESDFHKAWEKNSDGLGFGWKEGDLVCFKKGIMNEKAALELHNKLPLPFVTHFRSKSFGIAGGIIDPKLTHPFIISKESPLELEGKFKGKLLFMNGTESNWDRYLNAAGIYPEINELWTDARGLAVVISNENEKFLNTIWAKFAIIDSDLDHTIIYQKNGNFTERNGVWYSNFEWEDVKKKIYCHGNNNSTPTTWASNQKNYFDFPWNKATLELNEMSFRWLLNNITKKAAHKLWDRFKSKKDLIDCQERGIKILKQQNKKFTNDAMYKFILRQIEKYKNKKVNVIDFTKIGSDKHIEQQIEGGS